MCQCLHIAVEAIQSEKNRKSDGQCEQAVNAYNSPRREERTLYVKSLCIKFYNKNKAVHCFYQTTIATKDLPKASQNRVSVAP